MNQIELKTSPTLWVGYFIFFFSFSSISLIYLSDVSNLTLLLSVALVATVIVVTFLMVIYNTYNQKVILSDTEIKIIGNPSSTLPYNEIQKVKVYVSGFRIYSKTTPPILISNSSSNYRVAKKLLIQKIREVQNVTFEGSNRLIHKYLIEEENS